MIEIGIYREVSLAFTDQLARILKWAEWKRIDSPGYPDELLDRAHRDLAAAGVPSPAGATQCTRKTKGDSNGTL